VFLPTSEPNPGGGNDLGRLYAFDGTGNANCAGTPNVCTPLWTAPTATVLKATNPIVADGTVFMPDATHLNAYDAAGSNGCAGGPTVCGPLWTALTQYPGQPAAAGGLVYTLTNPNLAAAFDAHGQRGCGGTPNQCSPLWTSPQPFYGAFTTVVSDGWAYTMTFASFRGHSLNAYRLPAP
jgi:hypothetical protein